MVTMPAIVVLIVCKVAIGGPPDQNAGMTGNQNLVWATEHSMMACRRHEVAMFNPGEPRKVPTPNSCQRSGIKLGVEWDAAHRSSNYRFWRVACPTPIVDLRTGETVGWQLPECGHRDTVVCENDTAI